LSARWTPGSAEDEKDRLILCNSVSFGGSEDLLSAWRFLSSMDGDAQQERQR